MATLKDLVNKVKNIGLFNRVTNNQQPTGTEMTPIQLDEYGNFAPEESAQLGLQIKQMTTPRTLREKLFGQNITYDTQTIDPDGNAQMQTIQSFRPGLFNNLGNAVQDMGAGYRENLTTPFVSNNLTENAVNGNPKGLGYRIGEGVGTVARLFSSPLGRMALTAGLVGLNGGSGLEALAYGGQAGVINQNNRMKNDLYRRELENQGIDTSNISGYIGDDTFKQVLAGKTLQDNAEWRKKYFEAQQMQNEINNAFRQDQLARQMQQDAISNSLAYSRLANDRRSLDLQEMRYRDAMQGGNLSAADKKQLNENMGTLKDIEAGLQLIEENPNAYSLAKGMLPAWATNRIDPKGIPARTQIDNITAVYRKWLTGAQMSDQERKAYERFLPAPTDNYETVKAKLQGMYDSIQRKNEVLMGQGNYNASMNNGLSVDDNALNDELARRGLI